MVATIRMSRGALLNRRMMTSSIKDPRANDEISAMTSAYQNGQCQRLISETIRLAGTAPRSAWAKLITRFAL